MHRGRPGRVICAGRRAQGVVDMLFSKKSETRDALAQQGKGSPVGLVFRPQGASGLVAARRAPPPLHGRGPVQVQHGTPWKRDVLEPARCSSVEPASQLPSRCPGAVVPGASTAARQEFQETCARPTRLRDRRACTLSALLPGWPGTQQVARAGFDRNASRAGWTPYALRRAGRLGGHDVRRTQAQYGLRGGCGSWRARSRPHRNGGTRRAFGRRGGGAGSAWRPGDGIIDRAGWAWRRLTAPARCAPLPKVPPLCHGEIPPHL